VFELDPAQQALRAECERWAAREIAPSARLWDETERFPRALFTQLGELGWLGTGLPEPLGGAGGPIERALVLEEIARASAGAALGVYVHCVLAAGALAAIASRELARAELPALLSGDHIGAWAYAEPGAGADVTRVALSARRTGDHYVLDGTKLFITNGTIADRIVVVARTGGEPGRMQGLSLLLVDGDAPGLTRTPMRKLGMRASDMGELHFSGCRVPCERLVGEEHAGFRASLAVLSQGRIFGGALACGLARAALDAALAHVQAREQFGAPLGALQAVRFTLADMTAQLAAARALVYGAAAKLARQAPFDAEASIAKLVASEAATRIAERALHLHGASGFMAESDAQRHYRDCKVFEWGEGANEVQREMIYAAVARGHRP
jgi:alkylation response protein AidB-like acyl-CoA dehydrogenase